MDRVQVADRSDGIQPDYTWEGIILHIVTMGAMQCPKCAGRVRLENIPGGMSWGGISNALSIIRCLNCGLIVMEPVPQTALGKARKKTASSLPFCKCGCGFRVITYRNKFHSRACGQEWRRLNGVTLGSSKSGRKAGAASISKVGRYGERRGSLK